MQATGLVPSAVSNALHQFSGKFVNEIATTCAQSAQRTEERKRKGKSSKTKARLMAFALSLALDPTFGIHSHETLDTAQPCHLLKPN